MDTHTRPAMTLYHQQMLQGLADQGDEEAIEISTATYDNYAIPEHFNRKQRRAALAMLKKAEKKNNRRN